MEKEKLIELVEEISDDCHGTSSDAEKCAQYLLKILWEIRTIKNCIIFFVVLAAIGLGIGFIAGLIALSGALSGI